MDSPLDEEQRNVSDACIISHRQVHLAKASSHCEARGETGQPGLSSINEQTLLWLKTLAIRVTPLCQNSLATVAIIVCLFAISVMAICCKKFCVLDACKTGDRARLSSVPLLLLQLRLVQHSFHFLL